MRIVRYTTLFNDLKIPVLVKESGTNYSSAKELNSPKKIVEMMNRVFQVYKRPEEHVYMLSFDIKCHIKGVFELTIGTDTKSIISIKDICLKAILTGGNIVILVHNHPSGDPIPSDDDIEITKKAKEACNILSLQVADHIIIGAMESKYFSFKENGIL